MFLISRKVETLCGLVVGQETSQIEFHFLYQMRKGGYGCIQGRSTERFLKNYVPQVLYI